MGFVESVTGEFIDLCPDLLREFRLNIVGLLASFDKIEFFLLHDVHLLFPDGTADNVGMSESEACELLYDLHDLFLIQHDSVRLFEDRFHFRMVVNDRLETFFTADEGRDELHRPRTVDCQKSDDVFDRFHNELAAEGLHSAGFQLEYRDRVAAVQKIVGRFVVQRDAVDVNADVAVLPDIFDRVGDHGKRAESEKVHFQQAELFAGMGDELHDRRAVGAALKRNHVVKRHVSDDDTAGVNAGCPVQSFDRKRFVVNFLRIGIVFDKFLEFGDLHCFGKRELGIVRQQFGHTVSDRRGITEHTGTVLDCVFGLERPVSGDLCHGTAAVFLADVFDDFFTTAFAEVNVEVRR